MMFMLPSASKWLALTSWGNLLAHSKKELPLMKSVGSCNRISLVLKSISVQICDAFVKRCKSLLHYQEDLYFIKLCISGIILKFETVSHPGPREITYNMQSVCTGFGN